MRAALAAVLCTAVIAGCGNNSIPAGPDAVASARPGGTLRVGMTAPRAIAPWLVSAYDPAGSLIVRTMCDSILQWDVVSGRDAPALASSWRIATAHSLIFKLRKGLTFSDGRKVKGEDLVTSLSRAADSELASPVAGLLDPVQGAEALRGLRQFSADPKTRERISGITSPSPTTLQINLGGERADYLHTLGHTFAAAVPLADYQRDRLALERRPVCVGPYRLTAPWSPSQKLIRLERSKSYYAANGGYTRHGRGYADTIEFHVLPDAAAVQKAYQRGDVDVAYLGPQASRPDPDLVVAPTPTVEYVGLPVTKAPFDKPEVRLALSLALDREAIARTVYGALRTPLDRLLPSVVGDDYKAKTAVGRQAPCGGAAPPKSQVAAARRVLARRGVSLSGTALKLYFNDEFGNEQLMRTVADQWARAFGVKPQLVAMSGNEYIARGTSPAGFDGPFRFSWSPQVPHPDSYLSPLLSSRGLGVDNFSKITDSGLDFVLDKRARAAKDGKTVRTSYSLVERAACPAMALIPIVQGGRPVLVRQSVLASAVGSFVDRSTGHVPLRELFLTKEG